MDENKQNDDVQNNDIPNDEVQKDLEEQLETLPKEGDENTPEPGQEGADAPQKEDEGVVADLGTAKEQLNQEDGIEIL